MTRTPQPMRRMRYLIGEVISQNLVSAAKTINALRFVDEWMGGADFKGVLFCVTRPADHWRMEVLFRAEIVISAPLLTAPGPETVWIGPDLIPVVIQPRPMRETHASPEVSAALKSIADAGD